MPAVFLSGGLHLLPGIESLSALADGQRVRPTALESTASSAGLSQAALLPNKILNQQWQALNVDRMVRKTSERQGRWLMVTAVQTWRQYWESHVPSAGAMTVDTVTGAKTGLFLGLGTVDCDDSAEGPPAYGSQEGYIEHLLHETKPLMGLTLLNSSAGSHIAQLTGIKGPNAMFSPLADAGAQALIEAYFAIAEQQCEQALVAAGSQKVTPWYALAYRDLLAQCYPGSFATEAAAAFVATVRPENAHCQLYGVKRLFAGGDSEGFPQLASWLAHLAEQGFAPPSQIIDTGALALSPSQQQVLDSTLPGASYCALDHLTGYTGPAGALLAVQLGQYLLQQQRRLELVDAEMQSPSGSLASALIIVRSFSGSLCYFNIGVHHV